MGLWLRIGQGNKVDQAIVAEADFVGLQVGSWEDVTDLDPQPGIDWSFNPSTGAFTAPVEPPEPPPSPEQLRALALRAALQAVLDNPSPIDLSDGAAADQLLKNIIELQLG